MLGINTVEIVSDCLRDITFPTLSRPPVKPSEAPTEELVQWGTKLYTYSVVAHSRKILSALVQLANVGNIPAATILSRHVFELAAHACYMSRNLKGLFQQKAWQQAWDLLTIAAVANSWMKRHGEKYASPSTLPLETPDVLRIGKAISEYEEYRSQEYGVADARDTYSFLSEPSHPNSACFQQYHIYAANGGVEIGDAVPPISPLPFVNWCLIDILRFVDALFDLSNETTVRRCVQSALAEIVRRAPAHRT
jgi:hypothetical protein